MLDGDFEDPDHMIWEVVDPDKFEHEKTSSRYFKYISLCQSPSALG